MKTMIIFTLVLALATGATIATVDMDAVMDGNQITATIKGNIEDSEFIRDIDLYIGDFDFDLNEIFDYEKLIQVVAVTLNENGIIPDIKDSIWSLEKSTNFIANLPVK